MEEKTPSYYAVIPANVRYDESLRANEKLLFGEITTLTESTGECWASNNYFAKLYKTTPQAISLWVNHLKDKKYIDVRYEYDGKKVQKRVITISTNVDRDINKCLRGYQQNLKENNTSINNNKKEIYKERKHQYGTYDNVLLSDKELEKLKAEFPNDWEERIERVSEYCASKGKKYSNYLATIRNWARKEKPKQITNERKKLETW